MLEVDCDFFIGNQLEKIILKVIPAKSFLCVIIVSEVIVVKETCFHEEVKNLKT